MKKAFPDAPDWTFEIEEVSAGVYRVRGRDRAGRNLEFTGTDYDALLARARREAERLSPTGR